MLSSCASDASSKGHNSFYDEINCITYDDFEFHLDDTLSDISNAYAELNFGEENMIPPEDFKNLKFTSWAGQRYIEHTDTAALYYINDGGDERTFLYVTVTNNTSDTMSSYSLPINRYDTEGISYSSVVVPNAIQNMIAVHIAQIKSERTDEENKNLPAPSERKEMFLNDYVSLMKHNRGISQEDKTENYGEKVLDFVAKKTK